MCWTDNMDLPRIMTRRLEEFRVCSRDGPRTMAEGATLWAMRDLRGRARVRVCAGFLALDLALGCNLCIVPATAARGAATGKPRAVGMTCFRRCYLTVQTAVTNVASDWALTGQ